MILSLNNLKILYPNQLWLEISAGDLEAADREIGQTFSNEAARRRSLLNQVCLNAIRPWIVEEFDLEYLPEVDSPLWQFVNGTCVTFHSTRIALIPSQAMKLDELCVEQEWVDIPTWAAHYYVAIQADLEAGWLRISGYATHEQLQRPENYDPMDRTYSLAQTDLIEDLNVLWVARQRSPHWNPIVAPLPDLTPPTVQTLIEQLRHTTRYSPRLEVPFAQWAGLLANSEWRQALVEQTAPVAPRQNQLSQWLQHQIDSGWQAVSDLTDTFWRNYALAKGAAPQQKIIQLGDRQIALIVGCEPDLTARNSAQPGLRVTIAVYLLPGTPLTQAVQVHVQFAHETGSDTLEETIPAGTNTQTVYFPELLGNPNEEFSVTIALGTATHREDFVI